MSSSGVSQPLERQTRRVLHTSFPPPSPVSAPPHTHTQNNCVLMGEEEEEEGEHEGGGLELREEGRDYQGDGSLLTEEMIRRNCWPFLARENRNVWS